MIYYPVVSLPVPTEDELAHSARLVKHIRAELAASGGAIPFSRFMELALYAPGLGYYSAGARKFGAAGDFVTAPERSPLFSRCLARQCQDILTVSGGDIVELGAGTGTLAADLLLELEVLHSLPERYRILEVSGELRSRQRETLAARAPHLLERVAWLDALPTGGLRGVILGNEVLDALPVQRFRISEHGPVPLWVGWDNDGFVWCEGGTDAALTAAVNALQDALGEALPVGYESEFNPALQAWIAALAELVQAGVVLLIDYGYPRREYYHPQRTTGTLRCYYRHRVHANPLVLPGLQDITADVDFTAVAEAAVAAGLTVAGYTSQSYFLFGCGLAELLAEVDPADTLRYLDLSRQAKLLTLPGEMGERFKAIALSRGLDIALRGFAFFSEQSRL